jgi:hypothetical protein
VREVEALRFQGLRTLENARQVNQKLIYFRVARWWRGEDWFPHLPNKLVPG